MTGGKGVGTTDTHEVTVRRTVEPCDRFPCDNAYRGATHRVDEHGMVRHVCASNSDLDAGWSTGTVSFESVDPDRGANEAWQPFLRLDDPDVFVLLSSAAQAHDLAVGLLTSARHALEAGAGLPVTP